LPLTPVVCELDVALNNWSYLWSRSRCAYDNRICDAEGRTPSSPPPTPLISLSFRASPLAA